jgi:hypothetical protein
MLDLLQMQELTDPNDDNKHIPIGGTLGILAYGYRGIMAWRQVRHEHAQKMQAQAVKVKAQHEEN